MFFGQKNPVFESKNLFLSQKILFLGQKIWEKFGKSLEKVWKQRFLNIRNLQKIRNLFYSELSENYKKMILKTDRMLASLNGFL